MGTPAGFSGTGAPDHSYDTIYDFGGYQMNVADAAPGDRDYNGGRWKDVAGGAVAMGDVVRSFECPAIPLPKGR